VDGELSAAQKCGNEGGQYYTFHEICSDLAVKQGNLEGTWAPCDEDPLKEDGLNCCRTDGGPMTGSKPDIPWGCDAEIGATFAGEVSEAGPGGYYCGPKFECKGAGVCGDPHFATFEGEWYDFHGECDLTLVKVEDFQKGLPLDIQIRTKARYEYSYVESAAVKIGDDILQVNAYGVYFLNGVESADLKGAMMAGLYPVTHVQKDEKTHVFNITLGSRPDQVIELKSFKDLVSVRPVQAYSDDFENSVGMLGNYHTGALLGRDGRVVIDHDEFGNEWQVTADEPKLFQSPSPIEGKCRMPSKTAGVERRRLGETISEEAARKACSEVDHIHFENCVYDVMATGDLESVHAGVF
jgi:hypothetical protein